MPLENREKLAKVCKEHSKGEYSLLVGTVNSVLQITGAALSDNAFKQISENVKANSDGKKNQIDCHKEEVKLFKEEGEKALNKGDNVNAAYSFLGVVMNSAAAIITSGANRISEGGSVENQYADSGFTDDFRVAAEAMRKIGSGPVKK